jgi:HTH-type transcriptional repressor of NAD biosynthesis genes
MQTGKNEQTSSLYKIGVVPGKFLPPHRGHLSAIIHAATKCQKLYVVVSDHPELTKKLCDEA